MVLLGNFYSIWRLKTFAAFGAREVGREPMTLVPDIVGKKLQNHRIIAMGTLIALGETDLCVKDGSVVGRFVDLQFVRMDGFFDIDGGHQAFDLAEDLSGGI